MTRERVRATKLAPKANPKRDGFFLLLAALMLAGLLVYKMNVGEKAASLMELVAPSEWLPQSALDTDAGLLDLEEENVKD